LSGRRTAAPGSRSGGRSGGRSGIVSLLEAIVEALAFSTMAQQKVALRYTVMFVRSEKDGNVQCSFNVRHSNGGCNCNDKTVKKMEARMINLMF
jgi:hypothetical protein